MAEPKLEAALTSVMYYRKEKQAHPEAQRGYGSQWKVGNISKLKSASPTAYIFSTQKEKEGEGAKKNLVMDQQILRTVYVLYKIQKEHTLREGQPSFHNLIRDLTKNLDGRRLTEAPTYIYPISESMGLNCHFDRNFMGNLLTFFKFSKSFQLITTLKNYNGIFN